MEKLKTSSKSQKKEKNKEERSKNKEKNQQRSQKQPKTEKEQLKKRENTKENGSVYDSDSSDEDMLIRTGNVPRQWYKDFDHAGYDINSKKVEKPEENDEIEQFLIKAKNKDWWRNITDDMNNKQVYLSDKDLEIIQRIRMGKYASSKIKDDDEFFERNIVKEAFPLSNHTRGRKAFEPSLHERKMINRLAKLIEDGLIEVKKPTIPDFFDEMADIWKLENTNSLCYRPSDGYSMPKPEAPDNDLSYNFAQEENPSLRKIPKYNNLIQDQFERLNDIFQSARVIRKKHDITEKDILPEVPEPHELKPFPTKDNIVHREHNNAILSLCVEPTGDYCFSCDSAGFVFFSDILSSKVLLEAHIDTNIKIRNLCYNSVLCLLSVCCESETFFYRPKFLERKSENPSFLHKKTLPSIEEKSQEENDDYHWSLSKSTKKHRKEGLLFQLTKKKGSFLYMTWHHKGDFFAYLTKNELGKSQVHIHNLSSLQHFSPTSKNKGDIRSIAFHGSKPHFYVSSDSNVFIYDLKQQELVRKFVSNLNPINSISLHPLGADFVAGSLQGKISWFQSDLSEKPYVQMEEHHQTKIKSLVFHNKYNLFSSSSKEGKTLVYYTKVYDDFIHDPLIVPLTSLKSIYKNKMTEVNASAFHPTYPWLLTCGGDKTINIWS